MELTVDLDVADKVTLDCESLDLASYFTERFNRSFHLIVTSAGHLGDGGNLDQHPDLRYLVEILVGKLSYPESFVPHRLDESFSGEVEHRLTHRRR